MIIKFDAIPQQAIDTLLKGGGFEIEIPPTRARKGARLISQQVHPHGPLGFVIVSCWETAEDIDSWRRVMEEDDYSAAEKTLLGKDSDAKEAWENEGGLPESEAR